MSVIRWWSSRGSSTGRQLNTLQLNKWNPGKGRWTGLRRHGPNRTVGPTPVEGPLNRITKAWPQLNSGAHPHGAEQDYGGREIAGPWPRTEVPIGQDCRSTTESPTDLQATLARQLPWFDANVKQSSSNHYDGGVLGPSYASKELSRARWPARNRNTRERVRYAAVWKNWVIANR